MPIPGGDFLEEAKARGDEFTTLTGRGKSLRLSQSGPELEQVIKEALYGKGKFQMHVTVKGTRTKLMDVIPGHRWAADPKGPAAGPEPCDVMVIGKMLGEHEVNRSRCLMGPTGKLLLETVNKLGITGASRWYVTNVLKTEHPDDGTGWRAGWVKNFMHLLHQELRLVRPKYLLCLGSDAVKALLGKNFTLGKMEGRVIDYEFPVSKDPDDPDPEMHQCQIMASVHPAAVLRSPEMTDKMELAIGRFGQLIQGIRWDKAEEDLDHRIIDNEVDLCKLMAEIEETCPSKIIAMDAEWHGEHPQNEGAYMRCFQLGWGFKKAAAVVLRAAGGKPAFKRIVKKDGKRVWTTEGGQERCMELMRQFMRDKRPCGHFFCADMEWLTPHGLDLQKQFAAPSTWQECREKGGLDTALMAHAVDETGDFTLTGQTLRYTAAPRYDVPLLKWKEQYCKDNKIKAKDLEGFGECPDEVLYPYAIYDADVTWRICQAHMKNLDSDRFGNCCWEPFWISQRAALAVLEINTTGIPLDKKRVDEMTVTYMEVKSDLEDRIKQWAKWPEMNMNSTFHVRELLFGTNYNGKELVDGERPRLRPEEAISIEAMPILTTDKRPKRWEEVINDGKEDDHTASTNKMTLAIMQNEAENLRVWRDGKWVTRNYKEQIGWIRDYRFISQILKSVLRPPNADAENAWMVDDEGDFEYSGGLPGAVCSDGRIRTTIYQTKETGRWSSARPPLQNISKRREPDYKRILGDRYTWPLRSVITAPEGYVLVEADYIGAELFGMAIMSGDPTMIDHAQRNQLDESIDDFYDIHSNVAKLAFGYDCEPTKSGLKAIGKSHMRIVAKAVIFGIAYGRGAKAIALAAKEEGVEVSVREAQQIIDTIFLMYPGLIPFFDECRGRAVTPSRSDEPAPQWLCGAFGRLRRFPATNDRQVKGDIERQAMNFPIQGMIADAVSLAIANVYDYREAAYESGWTEDDLDFKICLQVHDAIMALVRYDHVEHYIDEVLPACMIDSVPIYPTGLDGVPNGTGPYTLGIDTEIGLHWGVAMTEEECIARGIDPKYA